MEARSAPTPLSHGDCVDTNRLRGRGVWGRTQGPKGLRPVSPYSRMSRFQVTLFDLPGHTITIPSTPNTLVSTLAEQFREVSPIKDKRIILTREEGPLKRGTLGENGIRNTITLLVLYGENTACIYPEPIAPHLHEWIKETFLEFVEPLDNAIGYKTHTADYTDLIAEYNEWTIGKEYLFFVKAAPLQDPMSLYSDLFERTIRYVPSIGPDSRLNITLYPNGIPSNSHDPMRLSPFSSVRGTLHQIKLRLTKRRVGDDYVFRYQFLVFLQGPIEIRDPQGTLLQSLDAQTVCMMKYDQIVVCDEMGQPDIPDKTILNAVHNEVHNEVQDNPQGGKRSKSKKSKKSKKTKRSTSNTKRSTHRTRRTKKRV